MLRFIADILCYKMKGTKKTENKKLQRLKIPATECEKKKRRQRSE